MVGASSKTTRVAALLIAGTLGVGALALTGSPATGAASPQPTVVQPTALSAVASPGDERRGRPPQLRKKGRWLVDQHGRVVIIHGLNLVWKHDPYVPPPTKAGFSKRDADWFVKHGFNGARLGTLWAGVTPEKPGKGDPKYRKRWQRVMDMLADRGIWMQLDAHQDQWHETYGGEGAPDWAMIRPAPFNVAPPVNAPFPTGYWTPEVSTVFDRFWANEDGLLDGWAASWKVAAGWWKNQPYLMGYDLMNEPWMGLEWPTCLTSGCPPSYANELQPGMEKGTRAVRSVDKRNIVWWEPQQFSGGFPVDTYFTPMKGEKQLGFSWHNYCPQVFLESQGLPLSDIEQCLSFSRNRQRHALDQSKKMNAVPLMSEWGATDTVEAIKIDARAADEHLMGWVHWAYKRWNDPTTADDAQGLFRNDADLTSVKKDKLRTLVRTYAQATAGTPLKMTFRPGRGTFNYTYRPDPKIKATTEIFVSPLHYPKGYRVGVKNGRVVKREGRVLHVRANGTKQVKVLVWNRAKK